MSYTILSYVGSHIGLVRNTHEDSYLLNGEVYLNESSMKQLSPDNRTVYLDQATSKNCHRIICTVADGMGGYQAGNVASLVAVQLLKQSQKTIIESENMDELIKNYQTFLNLLNQHILKLSQSNSFYEEMGSTLTSLLIVDGHAVCINLGDSPGYIYTPIAGLTKLTTPQNYGHTLLKRNEIKQSQLYDQSDYKHLISFIGMDNFNLQIEGNISSVIELHSKNVFLLCSDGLSDLVKAQEMEAVLSISYKTGNWNEAIETLISMALTKGGTDNITAMVIIVEKNTES